MVKVPKYGPTPDVWSPTGEAANTGVKESSPVQMKQEVDAFPIKEEPNYDHEENSRKDTAAYSAHSSGGLKLVFKSSPAHATTPDYKPDSSLDTSDSKSEEVSFNTSGDSTNQKDETGNGLSTGAVPFQDYIDNNHLTGDVMQRLNSSGRTDQQIESAALSSTGDVSEEDAAVAGLLSVSGSADNDAQLFDTPFGTQESEFCSRQPELFSDSCSTNDAVMDGAYEVDSAISGIMDDTGILQMDSDPSVVPGDFDNSQQESRVDYDSATSDDDVQLIEPDNPMQLTSSRTHISSNNADIPETIGGLNTEMESAINSILSLNDGTESNDFADMDEYIASGGAATDDTTAMFPSMLNDNTTESTDDGQDDIEAAVQSILM